LDRIFPLRYGRDGNKLGQTISRVDLLKLTKEPQPGQIILLTFVRNKRIHDLMKPNFGNKSTRLLGHLRQWTADEKPEAIL
jgi:hypothetical protein